MEEQSVSRREVLQYSPVFIIGASAGCISNSSSKTTSSSPADSSIPRGFETPSKGDCSSSPRPKPTPTDEGLEPLPYPEYPDEVTESKSKQFVIEYEKAARHNGFMADNFIDGTDQILFNIGIQFFDQDRDGIFIGTDGKLMTEDLRTPTDQTPRPGTETRSEIPLADYPFGSWYYLTDRFAMRKPFDDELPETSEPDLNNASTIYCG